MKMNAPTTAVPITLVSSTSVMTACAIGCHVRLKYVIAATIELMSELIRLTISPSR